MEIEQLSLPGWEIGACIGKGGFGSVYEISRDVLDNIEKCALKVVAIPQDHSEIEFMRISGMSEERISLNIRNQAKELLSEYSIMQDLRDNPYIVHCYDFNHQQQSDGPGCIVWIRMELLTPLMKAMDQVNTEDQIIKFGLDLCDALTACQKHKIIHRDIKPQNIFVSSGGNFKLGDFGISKVLDNTSRANTRAGTFTFMAPEVISGKPYDATVDIYSLGLVLYWLLNERRGPFVPLQPKYSDNQRAIDRRMRGDPIPAPQNGSDALKQIVLKACSFQPENRYRTAKEMKQALKDLKEKKNTSSQPEKRGGTYVVSKMDATGTGGYYFFSGLEEVGNVMQAVLPPDFPVDIWVKNSDLRLSAHHSHLPGCAVKELWDRNRQVYASLSGTVDGVSILKIKSMEIRVEKIAGSYVYDCQNRHIGRMEQIFGDDPKWSLLARQLYHDRRRDLQPKFVLQTNEMLPDDIAVLMMSVPMLEFQSAERGNTLESGPANNGPFTQKVFYLDEQHNFVPEEQAVKRVIQILDASGNMVQEIWQEVVRKPQVPKCFMRINGKEIDLQAADERIANAIPDDDKTMKSIVEDVYCKVGCISMAAAAELVRIRLETGAFPSDYARDLPVYKKELKKKLENQKPDRCFVNGRMVDLSELKKRLLLEDYAGRRPGKSITDDVRQELKWLSDQDAMALAMSILTTGKVPVFYVSESEIQKAGDTWTADDNNGPRDVPGDPPPEDIRKKDLDVHVTLNLDYLPSPKERSRMVNAAGKMIRVTLPGLVAENKDYVVKDGGKTDPKTGLTGDAYVRVKCKHSYFKPNSLGNILKDIGLLLAVVLYAIFYVVKAVVRAVYKLVFSKVGIVLIGLAAAVFVICHLLGVL